MLCSPNINLPHHNVSLLLKNSKIFTCFDCIQSRQFCTCLKVSLLSTSLTSVRNSVFFVTVTPSCTILREVSLGMSWFSTRAWREDQRWCSLYTLQLTTGSCSSLWYYQSTFSVPLDFQKFLSKFYWWILSKKNSKDRIFSSLCFNLSFLSLRKNQNRSQLLDCVQFF